METSTIIIMLLALIIVYILFCIYISFEIRKQLKQEIEFLEKEMYKLKHKKITQ